MKHREEKKRHFCEASRKKLKHKRYINKKQRTLMGNLKTESSAKKFIPTILFVKNEGPFFGGKIADE